VKGLPPLCVDAARFGQASRICLNGHRGNLTFTNANQIAINARNSEWKGDE